MDTRSRTHIVAVAALIAAGAAHAQGKTDPHADHEMGMADKAMSGHLDSIAMRHMQMTPARAGTKADTAKAWALVKELRAAIAKYVDTAAAVADGYKLFAPELKNQKTYHFTKNTNALIEVFVFNAARPTSLLYEKDAAGRLKLVGAMYTLPKTAPLRRLDDRVPTSITRWHKHVNWCVPGQDRPARWLEQRNGRPLFGPGSPIATRTDCDKVGGEFRENVFGWMVHINVFGGETLDQIFGDHHGG